MRGDHFKVDEKATLLFSKDQHIGTASVDNTDDGLEKPHGTMGHPRVKGTTLEPASR